MSLHSFVVLPITSMVVLSTSLYSFAQPSQPTPTIEPQDSTLEEIIEEEVTEDVMEAEVNPTSEEKPLRETAPQTPPPIVESRGSIHYTQDEVRLYPVLERICTCESGRQYKANGEVVRGHVNPKDIGMCQINLKYHGAAAESMELDLFDEADNIRYANWLYDQQGPQPWFWSEPCHGVS